VNKSSSESSTIKERHVVVPRSMKELLGSKMNYENKELIPRRLKNESKNYEDYLIIPTWNVMAWPSEY